MTKSQKKWRGIICCLVIAALIMAIVVFAVSCINSLDFTIGGKENAKLLDELNSNWVLDDKYELNSVDIDGLYGEWLAEKDTMSQKVILQLHGGAYIRSLNYRENLYQRMAQQYADISGMSVLTIDYRVAPETPYPAALDDALLAYNYLLKNGFAGQDIIVAGDSAGGGLSLALGLYLRDNKIELPKAIITMSAWTNLNYRRRTPDYVGDDDAKNPYISPICGDFDGFPPLLMQVGTKDITSDTTKVAEKAKEQGVDITQTTYQGMVHVFQALFPKLDMANEAWTQVGEFIENQFKENN